MKAFFKIRYILGLAVFTLITVCVLWSPVNAALEKGKYSETEKIGFAFYQLSKAKPDFATWITGKEKYTEALPTEKVNMLRHERLRLQNGMYNYFPDTDLIELDIPTVVKLQHRKEDLRYKQKEGVKIDIELKDIPENGYLPFQIGDIWVAVVVKNMHDMKNLFIPMDEFVSLRKRLQISQHANSVIQGGGMNLMLRPLSVDKTAPVILDGLEMWLMLADVGEMTLWRNIGGGKKSAYYTYTAPWYINENRQQLIDLYRDYD